MLYCWFTSGIIQCFFAYSENEQKFIDTNNTIKLDWRQAAALAAIFLRSGFPLIFAARVAIPLGPPISSQLLPSGQGLSHGYYFVSLRDRQLLQFQCSDFYFLGPLPSVRGTLVFVHVCFFSSSSSSSCPKFSMTAEPIELKFSLNLPYMPLSKVRGGQFDPTSRS